MIGNQFEFASPESLGIPSAAVAAFLRDMEDCRFPLHSYILMRHGKLTTLDAAEIAAKARECARATWGRIH